MKGTLLALLALPALVAAQTNTLRLNDSTRSVSGGPDQAVRDFALRYQALTGPARARRMKNLGLSNNGSMLPPVRVLVGGSPPVPHGISADINLVFDATGDRAFPDTYKTFLQTVFTNAKPVMNIVFGNPALGGNVRVANYDADIGDRDAVSGGYYMPDNGNGQREIRFPVFNNPEVAAVNFVHTLLLAYQGNSVYKFDAFEEGLVRAATMKIARTPAAMSGLDTDQINAVLASSYEVGPWYDWYNQRSLGASRFIAPNLRGTPLPAGGSIGGLYLMRYMMAGSAWEKLLVEYPGFISEFNKRMYAQPALRNDVPGLVTLGQTVLTALRPADPTVEGRSFADWFRHQYILETRDTAGLKLHVAPVPIVNGLEGQDFGVFDFPTSFFSSDANGNEQLLQATSYPIFWASTYDRLFPSTQDERMDIVAAYGSVTPNFPDENAGLPYRVAVDVPVEDQLVRVHVPAGAVATTQKPTPNDLYGTVEGVQATTGVTFSVRASINGNVQTTTPLVDGAFGTKIGTQLWLNYQPVLLEVLRTDNAGTTVVYAERINKVPGALAADLRIGGEAAIPISFSKGINFSGFPIDPFQSWIPDILNMAANQVLVARWNSAKYNLFPSVEPFQIGHAYYIRVPSNKDLSIDGYVPPLATPWSVALKPGWNMITPPFNASIPTSNVFVVRGTDFPASYSEAVGVDVGVDFFAFNRGNSDPISGVPETGSYVAATAFDPIRGYFVRCLAPEGVTLTFFPTSSPTRSVNAGSLPKPTWKLKVAATDGRKTTSVILAQSPTATGGFDMREDSQIPPSIGGFQAVSIVNSKTFYRDVRPSWKASNVYTVRLDGLKVGATYTVNLKVEKGTSNWLGVARDGGTYKRITGAGSISFVAASTSSTLTVKVVK